ncbi:MAG: sulfotransferase, partial [Pseudomonadota bacterium]
MGGATGSALPHFVIVGAMKCGTTTLFEQLEAQPGLHLSDPKEPEFFSDDAIFARGPDWYRGLFDGAPAGALCGEASTGYTKRPTYPLAAERLAAAAPGARIIYITRDPFQRLISHVVHEWTMRRMSANVPAEVARHPELIDYGRYAMQIAPYVELFGRERVHVTSLEAMQADPQGTMARLGAFLGTPEPLVWRDDLGAGNVSAKRMRELPFQRAVLGFPPLQWMRRTLIPVAWREAVKERLRPSARPVLPPELRATLAPVFAEDRAQLVAM